MDDTARVNHPAGFGFIGRCYWGGDASIIVDVSVELDCLVRVVVGVCSPIGVDAFDGSEGVLGVMPTDVVSAADG
jgi:hypothetical protein